MPERTAVFHSTIVVTFDDREETAEEALGSYLADHDISDTYEPSTEDQPTCPCGERLLFEIVPGYELNEWRSCCPNHGPVAVDNAVLTRST